MWTNRTTPLLGTINALRQCDSRGNSLITTPLTAENAALATRVDTEPLRQVVDQPNDSAAGDDQCIATLTTRCGPTEQLCCWGRSMNCVSDAIAEATPSLHHHLRPKTLP
ncbi:hypothetical protein J6590_025972 [Homalodisca vitripennis]|nr:hypothetical protein J6590_025972 [Homalodisca vitripennis]